MNYILNSKNRKFKYKLHLLFDKLSFNFLNLTLSNKITFVGIFLAFFSLFMKWFSIIDEKTLKVATSFSRNSGFVGFIIISILLFLSFIILSSKNKEKLKTKAHIMFYDYTLIIFSGILIFFLTIVILNSIMGFSSFYNGVEFGNGGIFSIIGSLFIILGGILSYKENKQEVLKKVYIENSKFESVADLEEYKDILNSEKSQNKSNMSLPI